MLPCGHWKRAEPQPLKPRRFDADASERRPLPIFLLQRRRRPSRPPHVHVTAGEQVAKFWLEPVELQSSKRLRPHEINQLCKIIERHQAQFLEAWYAHFET
ncbi:DUF4160 domain-containing protein [Modicisalibacter luteus]